MPKIFELLKHLNHARMSRVYLVPMVAAAVALADVLAIAAIAPFLTVVTGGNLEAIGNGWISDLVTGSTVQETLVTASVFAVAMILISAVARTIGQFALISFVQRQRHEMSTRILNRYLRLPYAVVKKRHSGELIKNALSEVDQVTTQVLWPSVNMILGGTTMLAVLAFLVWTNPLIALSTGGVLVLCYVTIFLIARKYLSRWGARRIIANEHRYLYASEALSGLKIIRMAGLNANYFDKFSGASKLLATLNTRSATMALVPRYAMESLSISIVVGSTLFLTLGSGGAESIGSLLPTLGLFAFAGIRLLPSLQAIYASMSNIRFGLPSVSLVLAELSGGGRLEFAGDAHVTRLNIESEIAMRGISYAYADDPSPTLTDISFTVPKGTTLGIAGASGSGKSTLLDVLLGLLQPDAGDILCDGVPLKESGLRNWQRSIGYVPQDVLLLYGSITENIALGVKPDMARVREVARLAQIDTFIKNELPDGYDTAVGERGARLSGGQRQRIGIARALYHDPAVLVFDEATSALDQNTEKNIMQTINQLPGDKIKIIVAHRLVTIQDCDTLLMLEHGRITDQGDFNSLVERSPSFRLMAQRTA